MTKYLGVLLLASLLLGACTTSPSGANRPGTAWAPGSFSSNGEQIYFTSIDQSGSRISYTGGPSMGGMMSGGYLACVSCHGPNARGGVHQMGMVTMNAPDIRWSALITMEAEDRELPAGQGSYDLAMFRQAVVDGQDAAGQTLSNDMPRWAMNDQDLADLASYLQSLP
jgi:cytochrome c oxidase subunit 2